MLNENLKTAFLEHCKTYGLNNPQVVTPRCIWHECLTKDRKESNAFLVSEMIRYSINHPKIYNLEKSTIPHFYYNGLKEYKNGKDLELITEEVDIFPFGDPYILPVFTLSNEKAACYFDNLLNPIGYYIECYDYGKYCVAGIDKVSSEEWENFRAGVKSITEQYIDLYSKDIPEIIKEIRNMWSELCSETGDIGSCVIGEGMQFIYNGQKYSLSPCSPYQGKGSWTPHVEYIKLCLMNVGATDIYWDPGHLD